MRAVLRRYSLEDFPSGLGGCRSSHGGRGGGPHPCCEYNVSVFDDRTEPDTVAAAEGEEDGPAVCIHHCSLSETRSNVLAHMDGLDVINDDGWELRTALAHLRERRAGILADYSRNCLADALFCASRASGPAAAPDGLSACWAKCAALYLADAVLLAGGTRPRPAHLLRDARSLAASGPAADLFGVVRECAGAERASPVLLGRMSEAAATARDGAPPARPRAPCHHMACLRPCSPLPASRLRLAAGDLPPQLARFPGANAARLWRRSSEGRRVTTGAISRHQCPPSPTAAPSPTAGRS